MNWINAIALICYGFCAGVAVGKHWDNMSFQFKIRYLSKWRRWNELIEAHSQACRECSFLIDEKGPESEEYELARVSKDALFAEFQLIDQQINKKK